MIKVLIYRLIGMLVRLGYLKQVFEMTYTGKIFSLNDLYRQGHWSIRNGLKKKYKGEFLQMLSDGGMKFCNKFFVIVFYNTRHDADNLTGVIKVLIDSMKGIYIPDDNKKYLKGLSIFPDSSLETGTIEFLIIETNS